MALRLLRVLLRQAGGRAGRVRGVRGRTASGVTVIPERIEVSELGGDHPVHFAYYGGISDGRMSRMSVMFEKELTTIINGATTYDYQVTRYGVHSDTSLCWILFMHTPIAERGKL